MAQSISIKAAEFIRLADRIAQGESPELFRNAFEERAEQKNRTLQDRYDISSNFLDSNAEPEENKYAAMSGVRFKENNKSIQEQKNIIGKNLISQSNIKYNGRETDEDSGSDLKSKIIAASDPSMKGLSENERRKVEELKKIDSKVRAHEMAHQAAGGGLVRGKSFNYTTGPDGKQYATGGEVKIDISPVNGNPDATIRKMQKVRSAALAPSDPSPTDRSVATKASQMESKARAQKAEEMSNDNKSSSKTSNRILDKYLSSGKNIESGKIFDVTDNKSFNGAIPGLSSLKTEESAPPPPEPPPPPPEPPPPPPEPPPPPPPAEV